MKKCMNFVYYSLLVFLVVSCGKSEIEPYSDLGYMENISGENYVDYEENPFVSVTDQPVSTFSVDADGGSYANMRRFINQGQIPPTASVRIEEYLNYFTFDYPEPESGENVSLNSELAGCPWNADHCLMRVGMKGKTIQETELGSSNYVFLIDVSGSMNSDDKLGILKSGFITMVDHMKVSDRVAIVTYAGNAGLLLESTTGEHKDIIKDAIDKLGAGGSTAGAEGIITAYEIALQYYIEHGNNRIIIGTDGDFNVGPSSTEELVSLIEEKRNSGVYLTVLGVGTGNLNDNMMEQIANKGNGNYEYIDSDKQIEKVFVNERLKFYTIAKDSKIQITFNPNRVDSYRLIGYENRSLNEDDFENDTTDAGEIGVAQTITAMYEVVLTNSILVEPYAHFDFRYKKPNASESRLIQHEIVGDPVDILEASENMRFATSVTAFGLLMKNSEYSGSANKQMVKDLGESAMSFDPYAYRAQFIQLVNAWD